MFVLLSIKHYLCIGKGTLKVVFMFEIIQKYFTLNEVQEGQIRALDALYREWNGKINVVSRKDIDNLYEHHVLHSLAIASLISQQKAGLKVLDLGTGGGFPGIPLAIMYPDYRFKLIDSIGKKVRVAQAIGNAIGLKNCEYAHLRAQEDKEKYDITVSRAVMDLSELLKIVRSKCKTLICLKGGNVEEEVAKAHSVMPNLNFTITPISDYFDEEWFKDKYVVACKL